LFCGSFATVAVKLCVWPSWIVEDAGATVTETAAWGVTEGGELPPGAGD
jgi:hypothetical protein